MKLFIAICLLTFFLSAHAYADILTRQELSDGIINKGDYTRLWKVMEKAASGEPILFCVIGGSVTEGAGATSWETAWGNHAYKWWRKNFPGTNITYKNIAIGATGSDFGAYRLPYHLALFTPDVVCVEYSVNDWGEMGNIGYEGVIRQCLSLPNRPAVVCVCHMNLQGVNNQEHHIKVIKYYDLPAVSIKNAVWDNCEAGARDVKEIIADSVHPTDFGHAMLAELVAKDIFDKAKKTKPVKISRVAHETLPEPLVTDALQYTKYYYPAFVRAKTSGWKQRTEKTEIISARDVYGSDWISAHPGSTLEFTVTGSVISVCYQRYTHGGGTITCYIDGKEIKTLDCDFSGGWGDYWATDYLATDLDNTEHTVTFVSGPNAHGGSDHTAVLTSVMTGGAK
ncbi:MAG: hypothetical protein IK083_01240 [Abditibacteriota bacterium]|nr:hypothetical protein [Abditibacteriota bacterium]